MHVCLPTHGVCYHARDDGEMKGDEERTVGTAPDESELSRCALQAGAVDEMRAAFVSVGAAVLRTQRGALAHRRRSGARYVRCASWSFREEERRSFRRDRSNVGRGREEWRRGGAKSWEKAVDDVERSAEQIAVKEARESGDELIYGVNAVASLVRTGRREIYRAFIQSGKDGTERKRENAAAIAKVLRAVREDGKSVVEVDKGLLNELVGHRKHQGVVVQTSALKYGTEVQLLQAGFEGVILVLDEVSDPHNVGAALRSALFLGADAVVVSEKNCAPLNATVCKASAGAADVVETFATSSLPRTLARLRTDGWRVVALAGDGGEALTRLSRRQRTAVVVGSEGRGLRTLVRRQCDHVVAIGGGGGGGGGGANGASTGVDSLNVSVAAAIALHHLLS